MRTHKRWLTVGAVLVALLLVSAVPVAADPGTIYVDPVGLGVVPCGSGTGLLACKTITLAVTMAQAADTILVAPGTYDGALGEVFPIVITQAGLTLKSSAGAATTFIDAGSTEAIKVDAANVTIGGSGFTIIGYGRGGLWVTAAGGVGLTVQDNIFYSHAYGESRGIYAEGLLGALIHGNEFSTPGVGYLGPTAYAHGTGIMIADADDVTISENVAHDLKYTWLTFKSERVFAPHGVLSEHCTVGAGEIEDVVITGNEAYDNGHEAVLFGVCKHSTDHEVPWAQDLQIDGPVTISGNDFYDNRNGVLVHEDKTQGIYTGTVVGADNIAMYQNNIHGNTNFDASNGQLDVVNAECNWWGAVGGPGVGKVNGPVDFTPWTTLALSAVDGKAKANGLDSEMITASLACGGSAVPDAKVDFTKVDFTTDFGWFTLALMADVENNVPLVNGEAAVNLYSGTIGRADVKVSVAGANDWVEEANLVAFYPEKPFILYPPHRTTISNREPIFSWTESPAAGEGVRVFYRLRLVKVRPRPRKLVFKAWTRKSPFQSPYLDGKVYLLKVRACARFFDPTVTVCSRWARSRFRIRR